MSERPLTIFLSAAEASGDAHAANLIRAIREASPGARFIGVAGERMAEAGCEVLLDLTHRASMLGGPLLRLGYYWRQVRRAKKAIRAIRPDLCIPVDSPAFNWHVAKAARKAGAKVLYYIAPQVWAWATWRVRKLARLTDRAASGWKGHLSRATHPALNRGHACAASHRAKAAAARSRAYRRQ